MARPVSPRSSVPGPASGDPASPSPQSGPEAGRAEPAPPEKGADARGPEAGLEARLAEVSTSLRRAADAPLPPSGTAGPRPAPVAGRYPLLEAIRDPADLRKLGVEKLPAVADELRRYITEVVMVNGGHLGSNLGTVELTLALHTCFDFLTDRLVWDVSHQTYAHKILTGRRESFRTLRQKGGLSGFTDPLESPYDTYAFGHAGTSLSTALGLACADAILKRDRRVVAVIGDAAIASGMPFEALNHGGELDRDLLIILNDNEMSISKSVGGLIRYFNKIRIQPLVTETKKELQHLVKSIPLIGGPIDQAIDKLITTVKGAIAPGHIFEELGFKYFGPIDGHNVRLLCDTLRTLKTIKGMVLLHLITQKGHGYAKAEEDPTRAHGISPRKSEPSPKAEAAPPTPMYTKVFTDALIDLAEKDPRVVAITAAMPDGTGLVEFKNRFPHRYFDTGITEQHAVGLASGLASAGLKPVAAIYSTFLQRGYDQLHQEICVQRKPVVFCLDRAGIAGEDGATHHGVFDIAYLRTLPGFVLMAPRDGGELRRMMAHALTLDRPVAIRYPRTNVPDEGGNGPGGAIETGRAEILREGNAGALIAYGAMVAPASRAAERLLAEDGLRLTVVNARFAKPIDRETIVDTVASHPFAITVEDHALEGGFGSAVLEALADAGVPHRAVHRVGIPDAYVPHGPRNDLLADLGLDVRGIAAAVRRVASGTPPRGRGAP